MIEYNASLARGDLRVEPEGGRVDHRGFTAGFGASIDALRALGKSKGYRLVHTELAGVNAFFVRADLAGPGQTTRTSRSRTKLSTAVASRPADPGAEFVEIAPYLAADP